MSTVEAILDRCQEYLHDNAAIWTREELLRWFNDGYRDFLAKTGCVKRIHCIDVPPRYAYTYCYEWEVRFTDQAPARRMLWGCLDNTYACTGQWEAELLEQVTPTTSEIGHTQDWERSHITTSNHHYLFCLPHNSDVVKRVAWDGKLLFPLAVRELDELDTDWYHLAGEPTWWTTGTGRIHTVEVFEIRTEYTQAYSHHNYATGFVRGFSGSRTYSVSSDVDNAYAYTNGGDAHVLTTATTALLSGLGWRMTQEATDGTFCTQTWEKEMQNGTTSGFTDGDTIGTYRWEWRHGWAASVTFGIGTPRSLTSPDRQYWAQGQGMSINNMYGGIRQIQSTEDAVEVYHAVVPQVSLEEEDVPDLLPEQADKYLRYYVLHRAFGRSGEGQHPVLSEHFKARFERGVEKFRAKANVAHKDQVWQRDEIDGGEGRRLPYVQLPSTFERAL